MPKIKPFHFSLTKVSQKQVQMIEGLLEFLPATGIRDSFHLAIRKTLQQYLSDVRYYVERVEPIPMHDFYSNLSTPCYVGILGMEPFKQKAFIELDPVLSSVVIDKLLGGKGEDAVELRPLTETEQGVIEFLLLKLLSQIHKLSGGDAKLHFRLEKMIMEPAHLRPYQKEEVPLVCLKIHLAFLQTSGFVKIYLPHPWILDGFLKNLPGDRESHLHQEMKSNLKNFTDLPMELWGSLGEASVFARDLKNLEEGDVVLFDETGVAKEKEGWQGDIKLLAGKGDHGGLNASWGGFKKGGRCLVTGSFRGGKIYG